MAKYFACRGAELGVNDIASALVSYYGAGVTIHYNQSGYLVFEVPAISPKLIRIYHRYMACFHGDAYVSGSTITNPAQFVGTGSYTPTQYDLVLGDKFILLLGSGSAAGANGLMLVAKTDGDNYILQGYSANSTNNVGLNLTAGMPSLLITWSWGFKSAQAKMYKQPLIIGGGSGYDTISGLYNVSHPKQTGNPVVGPDYLMSFTNLLATSTETVAPSFREILTPILAEFSSAAYYR